ncbi:MAG: dihydroorotase [Casimicrobium sp.]
MKIAIRNGRVIDPVNHIDRIADVFIAAGKIAAFGNAPSDWHSNKEINAQGLIVAPGLVDLAVHVKRGTLVTELAAAAAGGVTTIVCPPDTDPVLDEPGLVDMLRMRANAQHGAHLYPLGALTKDLAGRQLAELSKLAQAGCIGFSQADAPIVDTQVLWRAMQYAATFGFTVWLRPEDPYLAKDGSAHDGEVSSRLGLNGIPSYSETVEIARIAEIMLGVNVRCHISKISTARGVEMIRAAKAQGLKLTADVSIHQLHLTDIDIGHFNPNYRLSPPLRTVRDRDALIEGIKDGTIDAIVSDHTPRPIETKQVPFGEAAPGASAVELLLSLTLRLADQAKIELADALAMISSRAAKVVNLPAGTLSVGAVADVCVFDPGAYRHITPASLKSAGKNTPFMGYELPGVVRATIAGGHLSYEANA